MPVGEKTPLLLADKLRDPKRPSGGDASAVEEGAVPPPKSVTLWELRVLLTPCT
jgi:hypothetical protein